MKRSILLLLLILLSGPAPAVFAQTTGSSAAEWKRYSVAERDVSVLFPRLPVRDTDGSQICQGQQSESFAVYSNGAVYFFSITHKARSDKYCQFPVEFSEKNFAALLANFAGGREKEKIAGGKNTGGLPGLKFREDEKIIRLYNDPKNGRWFTLAVYGEIESNPDVSVFLDSFSIEKNPSGIEIGKGSDGVAAAAPLAPQTEIKPKPPADSEKIKSDGAGSGIGSGISSGISSGMGSGTGTGPARERKGVVLVLRPRPIYTEIARENKIQGVVRLKVVFNANGTIGSISPVSALGYGLTERAIAAARKIVFVPQRIGGVPVSVSKVIEYNFLLSEWQP